MLQVVSGGEVDVVATNYIKGYAIPGGIADSLFPRVPVGSQTGYYLTDLSDQMLQVPAQLERAPGTRPQAVGLMAPTQAPYSLPSRALTTPIPDERRLSYKFGDLVTQAATVNQNRIMTAREIRVAALAQNPANFPVNNTLALSGNSQIDNVNSDVPAMIESAKETVRLYAAVNTLIAAPNVASKLRINKSLIAKFAGVVPAGILTDQQLALILGVDNFIVAEPILYGANGRQRIWNNTLLYCRIQPSVGAFTYLDPQTGISSLNPLDDSFGKTFLWTEGPQTIDGYGVIVQRDPYADAKTTHVSNDTYLQEYITSGASGFLWTNCLQNP